MERYEAALIEIDRFEEDVITASGYKCTPIENPDNPGEIVYWEITDPDGNVDYHEGSDKPSECD